MNNTRHTPSGSRGGWAARMIDTQVSYRLFLAPKRDRNERAVTTEHRRTSRSQQGRLHAVATTRMASQTEVSETNSHQTILASPSRRGRFNLSSLFCWCREGGSNPHEGLPRRILSPLRLPVPPSRLGWGVVGSIAWRQVPCHSTIRYSPTEAFRDFHVTVMRQ
jgi:hypothetical protein